MEQRTRFPGVYRLPKRPGWYRVRGKYRDPRTDLIAEVDRVVAAPTAAAARSQRDALLAVARSGSTPQRMPLSAYAASWLERKAASLQPSTVDRYGRTLRLHILPALGSLMLDAIKAADVVAFRDKLAKRYEPATVNGHLRIAKELLADAAFELHLHNPAARVHQVSEAEAEERRSWDGPTLGAVLSALLDSDPEAYACVVLASTTAMRWSEVSALRWASVDLDAQTAMIERKRWKTTEGPPKTKRRTLVPLLDEVVAVLRAHYARLEHSKRLTDVVFPGTRGSRFRSRTWLASAMDAAIETAGVPRLTPHGLRHTANDLLSRVASPEVVRAITGHSTERMRLHYRHVDGGEKAKAQREAFVEVGGLVGKDGVP